MGSLMACIFFYELPMTDQLPHQPVAPSAPPTFPPDTNFLPPEAPPPPPPYSPAHQHSAHDLHALYTALGVFVLVSIMLTVYAFRTVWPPLPTRRIVPRVILALGGDGGAGVQPAGYMSLDAPGADGAVVPSSSRRREGWRVDMSKHREASYMPPGMPGLTVAHRSSRTAGL